MAARRSEIDDLVRLSGVSRSTVFRFLRGDKVRPQIRESLVSAMRELNSRRASHAIHRGSTLLISIRPDFKSFKGYDLSISGFVERAEAYGFHVRLKTGPVPSPGEERDASARIAGVMILGKTIKEEEEESRRLRQAGVPHVFVNRMFDDPAFSWVSIDHRTAARDAVAFLFDLGYTEVGTWGVTSTYRIDRDKRIGYLRAHEERGIPVPASCLDDDTHGDLEDAVRNLIASGRLPPAWFAASDEHAMRFIKVARDNGVSVPGDVAIVGMDDVETAEYLNPALTSVRIPYRAAGAAAFDVLKHLIENPLEASMRIVLKHQLVIRESCGSAREVPQAATEKTQDGRYDGSIPRTQ